MDCWSTPSGIISDLLFSTCSNITKCILELLPQRATGFLRWDRVERKINSISYAHSKEKGKRNGEWESQESLVVSDRNSFEHTLVNVNIVVQEFGK